MHPHTSEEVPVNEKKAHSVGDPETGVIKVLQSSRYFQMLIWILCALAVAGIIFLIICLKCRKRFKKKYKIHSPVLKEISVIKMPNPLQPMFKDPPSRKQSLFEVQEMTICKPEVQSPRKISDDGCDEKEEEEEEGKTVTRHGRLNYKLDYNFDTSVLSVTIIKVRDLPALEIAANAHPFVKVFLYPDIKKKYRTKTSHDALNPVFNETFFFEDISYSEMLLKSLVLSLYYSNQFAKNESIGEANIPLSQCDFAYTKNEWIDLQRTKSAKENTPGKICFSLKYAPTTGRLSVIIREARNLKKMDIAGLSDPYVKIGLVIDGKRIKKKKTSIKKNTLNPFYNESFTFELPFEMLKKAELSITVIDYDRIGFSDPIGKVTLSYFAEGPELQHWSEMLANPRSSVTHWHSLRPMVSDKT